ncbi:MAG TPA: phosphoadenylyl-sulfate reductase [Blastocatellia bacterium]|nr:phosphoadenylyl-sulfate reductase [Blastocatellia bacterium]
MSQALLETEDFRLSPFEDIDSAAYRLEGASPEEVLEWAFGEYADRNIAIATGFGAEGMALIDIAVRVEPNLNVFFVDTDFLFPETYALRERIEQRYGIQIRAYRTALSPDHQAAVYGPALWERDPDLCCQLRKLEPLKEALRGLDAWVTAIRRDQTPDRANARVVEWDARWELVKVNPLAAWTRQDVWNYVVKNDVPYNPLHDQGYPSIGCTHCTRAVGRDEEERAGRWSGRAKTECGLHGGVQPLVLLSHGAR